MQDRTPAPTYAEYIPAVAATVSPGTRRAYGTYWNRITEHWGARHLDEPTPTEIRQLMALVKDGVVARRNGRGGRSAQEHLVAALRCVYQRAEDDGIIREADNPARKVAKPRRLPSARPPAVDASVRSPIDVSAVRRMSDDNLVNAMRRWSADEFQPEPSGRLRGGASTFAQVIGAAAHEDQHRCP